MPEDCDARVGPLLLDHPGQQCEVVVLHQDDRPNSVFDLLEQGIGELSVDCLVIIPVAGPKNRAGVGDMAEWPQSLIGKSVAIPLFLFLGEPHAAQSVLRAFWRHAEVTAPIRRFHIRTAAALRNPSPPPSTHPSP